MVIIVANIIKVIVIALFVFSEIPLLRITPDMYKTPETERSNSNTPSMMLITINEPNSKAAETNISKSEIKRKTVNMFLNKTFELEGVKLPSVIAFFNAFFRQQ